MNPAEGILFDLRCVALLYIMNYIQLIRESSDVNRELKPTHD